MITTSMWTVISKSEENKNFAPKQNERDCPMTDFITGQVESGLLGSFPMYKKTLETLENKL